MMRQKERKKTVKDKVNVFKRQGKGTLCQNRLVPQGVNRFSTAL